ncbi:unnamed protein product [Microthlaspi erraticum]|uniref:GCK domain-containing protein n=1 Tax=Microthlaspi erraticum TaxID=1685480 RepID=A0A6D2JMW0_9BRAS|nr:unnamed protein product [Microthlaspi erraticum]
MGLTFTSSSNSNTGNNQVPPEKVGDSDNEWLDAVEAGIKEKWTREFVAMFSSKLGAAEREEEAERRCREFMKRGGCKEAYTALDDCVHVEEAGILSPKCLERYTMMISCMYSHSDYYRPMLALHESCAQFFFKELSAFYAQEASNQKS